MTESSKAVLILQDGTAFEGISFGKRGEATGEVVLYTGVVGYQEVITDPSYRSALVVFTYPIIGSYGVNREDNESAGAQVSGVIVSEYSAFYSNFRATGSLEDFLVKNGVVGIRNLDTRAVAAHIRDHGEMPGMIVSGGGKPATLSARLKKTPSPWQQDLVSDMAASNLVKVEGQVRHRIVLVNLGVKQSLLRQLAELGCDVRVLPASRLTKDVLSDKTQGVVLAGGPGDPRILEGVVASVKSWLGKVPLLGIGLGHQLLALALGCQVERMKTGHHGLNYPVKETPGGASMITAQHHSFVVTPDSLPTGVEVSHRNVNDGSVEGLRSTKVPAWSVQFHPGRDEMGRPSSVLVKFLENTCGVRSGT